MSLRLIAVLFGCLLLTPPTHAGNRPNILWITVEDMSPKLACYGDNTVQTPNVDWLAKTGVRYTHAFSVYGVCAPSRSCIITGLYPTSYGAMHMRTMRRTSALKMITDPDLLNIPTYEATPAAVVRCFTEFLRMHGYYCINVVKTDYQFATPLTAWDESSKKAHWRNRPKKDTPFFAVFNFTITHESKIFKQHSPKITDPKKVKVPPYYPDTPIVRRDIARNYDNIANMDQQIGKLLEQLREDGLMDNTIIFFFSDHGDGLPRAKRWVYDSGTHIPLIVRFPDGKGAGTTNNELVSFVDFAPTMLSLTGIEIPSYMQGQAFLGKQRPKTKRKYVFLARDRMDPAPETVRAVRDKKFMYVHNYRPDLPYIGYIPYRDQAGIMQEILKGIKNKTLGPDQWQLWSTKKPIEELYDCESDPHQIENLASNPKYFNKLAELRDASDRWIKDTGDLGFMPEEQLIKKLWPPNGKQPTTADPTIRIIRDETVIIDCKTKGASIAFKIGKKGRWLLYHEPVSIGKVESPTQIMAQANRIGWKPSKTVRATVK